MHRFIWEKKGNNVTHKYNTLQWINKMTGLNTKYKGIHVLDLPYFGRYWQFTWTVQRIHGLAF